MRNFSIILTVALIVPVCVISFSAYSMARLDAYGSTRILIYQLLSPIIIYAMVAIVACILNSQRKYQENCIMCGTVLSLFLISTIINVGFGLVSQWLR